VAIKGKRKTGARGSQSRRRPAGAPRAAAVAPRRVPWHQTAGGRVAVAVGVALLLASAWWAVATTRGASGDLTARREALETYSGEVQALVQGVRPAAQALAALPADPTARELDALAERAQGWLAALGRAREQLAGFSPPASAGPAHGLLAQALALWESAARAVRTGARADGDVAADVLARAGDSRDAANTIWLSAVALIDTARQRAELDPSGIGFPGVPAPSGQPAAPGTGG
jgi:hypothetical protein